MSNGPALKVDIQLLSMCLWLSVGVSYLGLCVCVSSHYDGDS